MNDVGGRRCWCSAGSSRSSRGLWLLQSCKLSGHRRPGSRRSACRRALTARASSASRCRAMKWAAGTPDVRARWAARGAPRGAGGPLDVQGARAAPLLLAKARWQHPHGPVKPCPRMPRPPPCARRRRGRPQRRQIFERYTTNEATLRRNLYNTILLTRLFSRRAAGTTRTPTTAPDKVDPDGSGLEPFTARAPTT